MNIQWNIVTWYSKLLAVIFFIAILPTWTFYLGTRYEEVANNNLPITTDSSVVYTHKPDTNFFAVNSLLGFEERRQLFSNARTYVISSSVKNMQFDLVFVKKINDWIKFEVIPENVETDTTQLYMQKVNGVWTGQAFGTAFPELWQNHPELFK